MVLGYFECAELTEPLGWEFSSAAGAVYSRPPPPQTEALGKVCESSSKRFC